MSNNSGLKVIWVLAFFPLVEIETRVYTRGILQKFMAVGNVDVELIFYIVIFNRCAVAINLETYPSPLGFVRTTLLTFLRS